MAIYFFWDWPVDIKPFPWVLSVQANGLGTLRTLLTRTGHGGRKGEWENWASFLKEKFCPLSGCRLQAGGEVVLKEIPFPMWPGPGVIYRSDYHHWQGRGWESWIKYTRPRHTKPTQHPKYSIFLGSIFSTYPGHVSRSVSQCHFQTLTESVFKEGTFSTIRIIMFRLYWCDSGWLKSNAIPTDEADRVILGNVAKFLTNASGASWWLNLP